MKTSKYLAAIMFISAIWILLDFKSPAQGFKLELSDAKPTVVKFASQHDRHSVTGNKLRLSQNLESILTNADVNKDFILKDITITQNSADKSLLTVTGMINNRSDQSHYVYYFVAKFIANDTAIKQTIIPVNIDLEPGQSKPFVHEISTDNINSIAPEKVKPFVVKYEYR